MKDQKGHVIGAKHEHDILQNVNRLPLTWCKVSHLGGKNMRPNMTSTKKTWCRASQLDRGKYGPLRALPSGPSERSEENMDL